VFWVWSSSATFNSLKDVFEKSGSSIAIAIQIGALSRIVLLYVLPWGKWMNKYLQGSTRGTSGKRAKAAAS
jgi:hypothetical protein